MPSRMIRMHSCVFECSKQQQCGVKKTFMWDDAHAALECTSVNFSIHTEIYSAHSSLTDAA